MPDPYIAREDIDAVIPPHIVTKALDDDEDDAEDTGLWDKIVASIQTTIDGFIAPRYSLPFETTPKLVKSAALTLTAERLYDRAGFSEDKNPWAKRAEKMLMLLEQVAKGQLGLGSDFDPDAESSGIVTEPSKTYNDGKLIV